MTKKIDLKNSHLGNSVEISQENNNLNLANSTNQVENQGSNMEIFPESLIQSFINLQNDLLRDEDSIVTLTSDMFIV